MNIKHVRMMTTIFKVIYEPWRQVTLYYGAIVHKVSGGIRVRIPQELDVVVFCSLFLKSQCYGFLSSEKTPRNHDFVAYLSPFLDVVLF